MHHFCNLQHISLKDDVAEALSADQPVVALESTLIAHGLPHPHNIETALALESLVRDAGAVPATIALIDGRIRIGLEQADLERLATAEGIVKVSRADMAVTLASGKTGATTVAATMIAAHMAGISLFATGGIGGVHRGATDSFDISADITELGRTPVAVIASGAKTLLDLPKTLELLETAGVPVVGYGTDEFPGFYCQETGLAAPHRCDGVDDLAKFLAIHFSLPSPAGALIANPVPSEVAMDGDAVEQALSQALEEAAQQKLSGKAVTPYLLGRIFALTGGDSLKTNIALIRNNATLAAKAAVALSALRSKRVPPASMQQRVRFGAT